MQEGDRRTVIHVPTTPGKSIIELSKAVCYSLDEIGIPVSTGPVVDFRLRKRLRDNPESGTVPLLYACRHFTSGGTEWPELGRQKPNAICWNSETEKWLYPSGCYCVVRRFSSKEEKRRSSRASWTRLHSETCRLSGLRIISMFSMRTNAAPNALADGLAAYLNTPAVDENFRRFNGRQGQRNGSPHDEVSEPSYPNRNRQIGQP